MIPRDCRVIIAAAIAAGAVCAGATLVAVVTAAAGSPKQIVWTFDRLDRIGGIAAHAEGHPRIINSPVGKAIEFNGVDDALFIDTHPLAGAEQFTFEAIFRPDGGNVEQRWFHLAERDPKTGQYATLAGGSTQDSNTRFLFELRVVDNTRWYLDAFVRGPGYSRALMFPDKVRPLGQWYHVAQTFDGKTYRSYVNGELQGEAEVAFTAQGEGRTSVGVRMNHVNYFKGAVAKVRFTFKALTPAQFMTLPTTKK